MSLQIVTQDVASRLKQRRKSLLELIAQTYPEKSGMVLLLAPIEMEHYAFVQDSSFYYFSGISQPAMALSFAVNQPTILHMPHFADLREKWVDSVDVINEATKSLFGLDELCKLGAQVATYQIDPYFSESDYKNLIEYLRELVVQKKTIFTLYPQHVRAYASVKMIVDRLALFVPGLMHNVVDISPQVAQLRRKKDMSEIQAIHQAVTITEQAFQAAAQVIKPGVNEAVVQATIEYIFTELGAKLAYSSIVAGAKRATILHYHTNNAILTAGDLVLIDAGAMFGHYCADITRVFPVSGKFSKEQKKLYEIVLQTQELVVEHIRPGVYLNNEKEPENSLQHIAIKFLKKQGYDQYFIHGIGHYLGLDVHDVGSRATPLEQGDVITVEPGIYLPHESVGIRIEDNYWVIDGAPAVCLSENIAKLVGDVEAAMR
ncbi:hypothetical protein A3J41_03555 [candidate division TM6 bacterium RIFCSPHIGHO2_12_FULL_38_8]|nr:MAG: hypothetical protein A3J41_03555 [candidate division TM6 bacterium RIFCSPHIGHO2_12_FULL_38_8]